MTHHFFERRRSHTGRAFGIGLVGAAIGSALTYYLYVTQSGSRRRKDIRRFANNVKDRTMETAGEIGDAVSEMYENVSTTVHDRYEDLKNIDKKEISALSSRIRDHFAEIKDDIADTIGRSKKK